jgi:hypothetical protein
MVEYVINVNNINNEIYSLEVKSELNDIHPSARNAGTKLIRNID